MLIRAFNPLLLQSPPDMHANIAAVSAVLHGAACLASPSGPALQWMLHVTCAFVTGLLHAYVALNGRVGARHDGEVVGYERGIREITRAHLLGLDAVSQATRQAVTSGDGRRFN